jgi:vacuolar protein sorting-associated protein 41
MVFLLGRMGSNKQALTLIIERLGDVHRAIDFAKEQSDDDLWEDLLKYSETRPSKFNNYIFLLFISFLIYIIIICK